jgi:hypothetical protein
VSACKTFSHQQVHQLLDEVLGPGLHAKRIASLADATLGAMHTASLAVCTIGHGMAMARGLNARHAVKQVVIGCCPTRALMSIRSWRSGCRS